LRRIGASKKERTMNVAVLRGELSRDPEMRELPSGDRIVNYEVTIRDTSPAESVPVVWVEPSGSWDSLEAGDEVVVAGRVRRRFFRTSNGTVSRTEVVAERVVSARHAKRVQALLTRAAGRLGGDAG
jgi:single-strand DNA-binding protein